MSSSDINDQLVLVTGYSTTGKSASLRNIENQNKWLYLNTEAGKRLPFKDSFMKVKINHPDQVLQAFDQAIAKPDKVDGIILDSLTFLMEMYESKVVLTSSNTMKGWANYNQYFKTIMQDRVIRFSKPTIFIAHSQDVFDEQLGENKTSVPIKGALKGTGVEAYFSTIVSAKRIAIKELEEYNNDLLHITEEEELLGFKHVFQTRLTKATKGERLRSPIGMWAKNETYIDNDVNLVLKRLNEFYN